MKNFSLILLFTLLGCNFAVVEQASTDARYIISPHGVIKDKDTGLMWTQKDSYADLGHSLNWNDSKIYVERLSTGGYSDWRLPTVTELKTIYEPTKTNWDLFGGKLRLDPVFKKSGTYNYWSSETAGSCCAVTMTFDYGHITRNHRTFNGSFGVRAVRKVAE